MKTVTIQLPEDLASWLERESKQMGRSKSAFVREMLEGRREGKASSVLDTRGDFCGSVDSQRGDLSRHHRYLKGFGT
jgi:hypothetical protein